MAQWRHNAALTVFVMHVELFCLPILLPNLHNHALVYCWVSGVSGVSGRGCVRPVGESTREISEGKLRGKNPTEIKRLTRRSVDPSI
jgi:hypothetical protein